MKSTLEELKNYQSDAVVNRFIETWDLPFSEAKDIFEETKKWLWLSAYNQELKNSSIILAISQSTKLLDEMWHTFILFTKDYHDFCDRYFGYYVHHFPTPKSHYEQTIREYEENPDFVMSRNEKIFAAQYELIYDVLGEETLIKWYSDYLEKYTDDYMKKIWRWSYSPYDTRVRASVRLSSIMS
ncbi:hypothetical protein IQ243_20350 [Nostocales cyanobacterium LEGE 11386]|nr:hypothetical protein [Nostocales cyanobacterium LEGE 11386]